MLEARGDLDLREEALDTEHGAERGIEDLERDLAVVLAVTREIDRRHATAREFALHGVAAREGDLQVPRMSIDPSRTLGGSQHA